MDKIIVKNIYKNKKRIDIEYEVIGESKKYFNDEPTFFVEYDQVIEDVPDGICVIPFLANVLPIAWVLNLTVIVDEIDKDFFDCLIDVKKGYSKMLPQFEFEGNLEFKKCIENKTSEKENVALFFSGGLDSFSTLIGHLEEKPEMITLWGSDIKLDDVVGWGNVKDHVESVSNDYGVKTNLVKTNFRTFLKENELDNLVSTKVNDGWWHAFQHGIGIIAHAAPITYLKNITKIYFASSYSKNNPAITCASDPKIDNFLRFNNCSIVHDQYEYTRMDKAKSIIKHSENTNIFPKLRVCWITNGGKNCCKCEKCYRTIYEIIACGGDPNKYGLEFDGKLNKRAKNYFMYKYEMPIILKPLWKEIRDEFIANKSKIKNSKDYNWIIKLNFEKQNNILIRKCVKILRKIKAKVCEGR